MTPSLFAGAFVVDNLSTVPWMLGQVALASALAGVFLRRAKPDALDAADDGDVDTDALRRTWTEGTISITHLAILAAIPLLALAAAGLFAGVLPGVPEVLWLTTMALILGQIPAIQRLQGSAMLSYFALHLFFIVIGAGSRCPRGGGRRTVAVLLHDPDHPDPRRRALRDRLARAV